MMEALFRLVLQASAAAGVLTCMILLLKRLLGKRAGAGLQYAVWFVLLIRLCMPVTPQSPLSLFNLFPSCAGWSEQIQAYAGKQADTGDFLRTDKEQTGRIASQTPEISQSMAPDALTGSIFQWASLLWLCGLGIFFCSLSVQNAVFRHRIKRCSPCEEERVLRMLEAGKKTMNVAAEIPVLWCTEVPSPSLYGVFRPRLLLPPETDGVTDRELYLAFLHELVHYRRKDILFVWMETFLKAVHWFNPLVWYGFYRMRQDCEIACDAVVLSHVSLEDAELYGQTLLYFVSLNGRRNRAVPVVGLFYRSQKSDIRRRFIMMANFKKPTWKTLLIGVVALAALGAVGLTGALHQRAVPPAGISSAPSSVSSSASGGGASSTSDEYVVLKREIVNGREVVYFRTLSSAERQQLKKGINPSDTYGEIIVTDKEGHIFCSNGSKN